MPTSLQSAPARCEFRGGIEDYCSAAASVLAPNGLFVVCENWLNNDRVYLGAKQAGLHIKRVVPIKGTTRKTEILFAIYVMSIGDSKDSENSPLIAEPVSVRNKDGKWTRDYADIMMSMSIPEQVK